MNKGITMLDGPETWLLITCLILVVIGILAQFVPTRKHEEDTTAYWKRKISESGKRQQWGGR